VTDKRRGLGRGLGALIPSGPVAPPVPPVAPPRGGDADGGERTEGTRRSAPFGVDVLIPERAAAPGEPPAESPAEAENHHTAPETADNSAEDTPRPAADRSDGEAESNATQPDAGDAGDPAGAHDAEEAGAVEAEPAPAPEEEQPDTADETAPGGQGLAAVPGATFAELAIDSISPNPRQPRTVFDEEAMDELVHSIREIGLLQPVVVRPVADGRYELVMGERRWRASTAAGLERIPAIVRSTDDTDMLRDALLENLHRSQLNPLEEAAAYDQLLQDFGCTHDELATRIGRSRPQVSNTLRLLRLPPLVQRRVAAGVLSAGHARALLGLDDAAGQERLAQRIVAEGLSVRAVEEIVALGGPDGAPAERARRSSKPVAPRLQDLAESLSDRFETRVKVDLGRRKGRIVVEFASLDDLERIVGMMNPSPDASE
jgi:ParB family chromosome partitioning protein